MTDEKIRRQAGLLEREIKLLKSPTSDKIHRQKSLEEDVASRLIIEWVRLGVPMVDIIVKQ